MRHHLSFLGSGKAVIQTSHRRASLGGDSRID